MSEAVLTSFGPAVYGGTLHIDEEPLFWDSRQPTAIDVETDEKDNFVGAALTQDGKDIYYCSGIELVKQLVSPEMLLIGHNLKFDLKMLKKWGVEVSSGSLHYDTALASYVVSSTRESHSLKDLAKDLLGLSWPTYKEMVGKGAKKVTLDKQEIGRVAAYCGMDTLATFRLYQYFQMRLTPEQRRILNFIELPVARILMDMELQGARVDVGYLQQLDAEFTKKLEGLTAEIQSQWKAAGFTEELNVNSNMQIAKLLEKQGAVLPTTDKGNKKVDKATLNEWANIPVVPALLEYNKIEKLKSTYTTGLLERQIDGVIYGDFNQITRNEKGQSVGIATNRLSSSNPNLQNIPARSEEGKTIRKAFVAQAGYTLIDADYSQIEYRLLAHFTKEPKLIQAFKEDHDVHEETGKALGVSRDLGKTLNFAAIYGAQGSKIARTAKISESDAARFLESYWRVLPRVTAWIERVKFEVRRRKGVYTLNRRFLPLPGISSSNKFERYHWERAAVNYTIQGSAAEVMKLALIKLTEAGYRPRLTVHDEFVFESRECDVAAQAAHVKHIMETVVNLDVPIVADVGTGYNWGDAKGA
jgi:DNA polymerase-1